MKAKILLALVAGLALVIAGAFFVYPPAGVHEALGASAVATSASSGSVQPARTGTSLTSQAAASLFPSAPAPCPDDPNDLAGIEGYAPGAGGTSKTGQTDVGSMGGLGGALGGEATPPPSNRTCSGITPGQQAYFDLVQDRVDLIPQDGYDPGVRARELGDANAMYTFVRDRIRTEAYAGAMRGPSGTLQSRGGSPLDKAYLLAAMLQTIGVPAHLMHAPLTDAELQQVVSLVKQSGEPSGVDSPQLASALQQAHVDAPSRQRATENVTRVDRMADQGVDAAQTPTGRLIDVLTGRNLPLATTDTAIMTAWRANLRDHWWLRVQQNGTWADWDPTLPNAAPGTHLGASVDDGEITTPPDDQKTTVTVRIVAEHADGSPAQTLVESSATTDGLYGVPVAVVVGDRTRGTVDLKDARSFTPSIALGGDETTGDEFALDPDSGPRVTTLRLQIGTAAPGQPHRLTTRTFLDRRKPGAGIDPSWTPARSAYAATTAFSMLIVPGEIDPGFAARREADGLKALRAFIAYVAAGGNGKQMPPNGLAPAYPMESLHYLEQDAIVRRRVEAKTGARFHVDVPQIVMMRRSLKLNGDHVLGTEQFDIVENAMTSVGADAGAAVHANFVRGYLDTVIEQHLLAAQSDGGTIALFSQAARAGISSTVSTVDGNTAIVPSAPVVLDGRTRVGWWQVDRATGNLVGRMDDGAGQELVEYAMARANDWSTMYAMVQFYGDFFRCIAGAVEGPLAGREPGSAGAEGWFKQCAGAALCGFLEALSTGEAFSRMDNDLLALIYNVLDLSITGTKDAWPPTVGAVCSATFSSPFGTPGSTG